MMMDPDHLLDALLTVPGVSSPALSPDGRWVAWTWFRVGPVADAWVAPTDGSAPPMRLEETPEVTMVQGWTADSKSVLLKEDNDGDERERIFKVDLDRPGVMIPLMDKPTCYIRGGQISPDGRWLVFGANLDPESGQVAQPTCVYKQDMATGARHCLARPTRGCFNVPRLNRQGTHILYQRNDRHPAGREIWMVDIDGHEDRLILSAGAHKRITATWHPDGQRVIFVAAAEGYRKLGLYDRTTAQTRWLIDDPTRNIEAAWVPAGSPRAVVLEIHEARTKPFFLDLETGLEQHLGEMPGSLTPLGPTPSGRWVGAYESSRHPTDLVAFDPDEPDVEDFVSITRVWERTPLRPRDLSPAEDFRWHSHDGTLIQGWLYKTHRGPSRGLVVHIHGGPSAHSSDKLSAQIQFLCGQGFDVLDPNYRGSTGFSLAFQDSIKVDGWGGREQIDIQAGIEALIRQGLARPGKVGVTGTSYGGYSSWHLITHLPRDLVAAAAPICGMTDLVVDYETTRPDLRPLSEEMMGGSPSQVPERYRERSPIHFVDKIEGELLIVQGARDPNVTRENVAAVEQALKAAGVKYRELMFQDEGHGIIRPHNCRTLFVEMARFFSEAFGA